MGTQHAGRSARRTRRLGAAIVIALSPTLTTAACSSSGDGNAAVKAALSDGCNINSDCNTPLVCAFRRCHTECTTTRDCPMGQRCMASDRPFHVCQLPAETKCAYNSDCPMGQVCGADGQCRDQCTTDRDCVSGQQCASGTCAEITEVSDAGTLADATVDSGQPCSLNSDCSSPLICRGGFCAIECKGDVDCATGKICDKSRCVVGVSADAGPDASAPCTYNSDCASGLVCHSGKCGPACVKDVDCNAGQACVKGACVAGDGGASDGGPSDAGNDATTTGCNQTVDCSDGKVCVAHVCVSPTNIPDGAPDGYASACTLNSDCPLVPSGVLVCKGGACVFACNGAADCNVSQGECCVAHSCVTGPACLPPDAGGTDAGDAGTGDAGPACVSNDQCDDGLFCNGIETCFAGHCAPALDTPCNSHSACVKDGCVESTHQCTHMSLGTVDGDGDGHLAFACGGDDCNDSDGTVYTGAAELCDGKDNDCNGLVDDRSRRPFGSLLASDVGAPHGAGTLSGGGALTFTSTGGTISTEVVAPTKASMYSAVEPGLGGGTDVLAITAAGGPSSALYLAAPISGGSVGTFAVLTKPDGTFIANVPLANVALGSTDADVVWTGSRYLVGYRNAPNAACGYGMGNAALIAEDGTVTGGVSPVPTPGLDGCIWDQSQIRVGASPTTLAIAYTAIMGSGQRTVQLLITGQSLDALGPPVTISTTAGGYALVRALAGTPGGFVLIYTPNGNDELAVFVANDGTVGTPTKLPAKIQAARGASDGAGAAFLLQYATGPRFGYFIGGASSNPFELTPVAIGGSVLQAIDTVSISGIGGKLGLFFYSAVDGYARGTFAGCGP